MRNEQKNNNAYLASILTMLLLVSSIPLLHTAQANMSDNVFLIGDKYLAFTLADIFFLDCFLLKGVEQNLRLHK